MRFLEIAALVLLCVLVCTNGEKERRRSRRRPRSRRCNCDHILQKVTLMMDKKLQVFEQRLGKIPAVQDKVVQQYPGRLKLVEHKQDMFGKELKRTQDLMNKHGMSLQHTRQFLHDKREDFVSLNAKYTILSKTVQRLTSVVEELEKRLVQEPQVPVTSQPQPYSFPKDCDQVYRSGGMRYIGDYYIMIKPHGAPEPFRALCKVFNNSGWTVIQKRQDGSIDFYRNWTEYKTGFGVLEREFWLGNDNIHYLTAQGDTKLLIQMQDMEEKDYYAAYDEFRVDDEKNLYTLNVKGYSGDAGDSLTSMWNKHDGKPFSTKDRDNDGRNYDNCAEQNNGAWWFNTCFDSHLNGKYYPQGSHSNYFVRNGILWNGIHEYSSLKRVTMMVTTVHSRTPHTNDV